LKKLLLDLGFNNRQIISDISKSFNFKFIHDNTNSGSIKHYQPRDLYLIHIEFAKKYPELYQEYLEYIYKRMGNINPIDFGLYPEYNNNQCYITFTNKLNSICVKRSISYRKFFKPNQNEFYFFQDFSEIYSTRNVYICEGAIDLINLYNHGQLNNGFYIAMNGTFYNKVVNWLVQNHCVIGKYNFHVFFDKNTYKMKEKIKLIKQLTLKINQNISFNFYKPAEKDVSELMMYFKI
jgi:hypothetical protein